MLDKSIRDRVLAIVAIVINSEIPLTVKDIQCELERWGFHQFFERKAIYKDLRAMVDWGFPIELKHERHNQIVVYRRLRCADATDSRDSNVTKCIS